tara:strand:+ start:1454 stop:1975 length:522 start_codon:yes stop_codon:yes gene_type:complete
MTTLRLILGDQLNRELASLRDINIETDIVLMAEVGAEVNYAKHYKSKIAFLFSAMRHFAGALRDEGVLVIYSRLDDPENGGTLESEVKRVVAEHKISKLVVTMPSEYRLMEIMRRWQPSFGIAVDLREDDRFLCSLDKFESWADGRRQLRMDHTKIAAIRHDADQFLASLSEA